MTVYYHSLSYFNVLDQEPVEGDLWPARELPGKYSKQPTLTNIHINLGAIKRHTTHKSSLEISLSRALLLSFNGTLAPPDVSSKQAMSFSPKTESMSAPL